VIRNFREHRRIRRKFGLAAILLIASVTAGPAWADSIFFSTGDPDGNMAMASRPSSAGKGEIEAADDFVLTANTSITSATFTGLLPAGSLLSDVTDVRVEIYRVFPKDSTFPPNGAVPTRTNSPSDVEFDDRSASAHNLTFTPGIINSSFTSSNSILNGISVNSGGDGAVTGQEVRFNVLFSTPFSLPADHYFFVPQVQLSSGDFFWLSAPKPIVPPGTSFPQGFTDLQTWTRNENLDPNWLRVGTDIVGGSPAPQFNSAFSLAGSTVPEPSSIYLLSVGSLSLLLGSIFVRRIPTRA
jgi:hypothetical protein